MPLYNWQIIIPGQTEAPNEDALAKTLKNQVSMSMNVAGSAKTVRIEIEAASGLVTAQGADMPKLREH
jgi:hypothetical protein